MLTVSKRDITSGIGKELLGGCLLWVRFFSYQISLFFSFQPKFRQSRLRTGEPVLELES